MHLFVYLFALQMTKVSLHRPTRIPCGFAHGRSIANHTLLRLSAFFVRLPDDKSEFAATRTFGCTHFPLVLHLPAQLLTTCHCTCPSFCSQTEGKHEKENNAHEVNEEGLLLLDLQIAPPIKCTLATTKNYVVTI